MPDEHFFPPPRPLQRTLNGYYIYNGEETSVDPRSLNNEDQLLEKVERMQAIIDHELNHPEEDRRSYSQRMQEELAELAPLVHRLNTPTP